jgi:hypothetical protein
MRLATAGNARLLNLHGLPGLSQWRRSLAQPSALAARSRAWTFAAGLAVVLLVGLLDWATAPLISFAIFYLIPVLAVTWLAGRLCGSLLALAAALAWALADQLGPASAPRTPISYWNDVTLLLVFLLVVSFVSSLKTTWEREGTLLAEVQRHLLPASLPAIPGCEVAAAWRPAGVMAGDYYDVLPLGGGALALCIADVSGKGIPAALVMSNVQAAVRALADREPAPARLVERLNSLATVSTRPVTFITLFYGVLEPGTGRLRYCNAGHNPPLLVRRDGSVEQLERGGPILGFFPEARFAGGETALGAGDSLVLYTDGLSEHGEVSGEQFGEERIVSTVRSHPGATAQELCAHLVAAAEAHGGALLEDDLTLLVVRRSAD